MISIFEAKDSMKCVCKDFEVLGNDGKARTAKNFLKKLRERQEALNLDYEQCRDAAQMVKHGDLEGALKKIWKGKVKTEVSTEDDGYTEVKEYDISGYATFTERICRANGGYYHVVQATYVNNPEPSTSLRYIIEIRIRPNSGNMAALEERMVKDAWSSLCAAHIYNFLFVCYEDYNISNSLNKFHLKLKNKFKKK